jgi:hypothetical protein
LTTYSARVPTQLFHGRRVLLSIVASGHGVQHFAKARCGPCLVRYAQAQAPRWSLRISRACSCLADNQWQIKRMASNQRKKLQQQQQLVINIRSDSKTSVEQLQGISEVSVSLSTEQTLGEFNKDRILVYTNKLVDELYGRLVRRGYMLRIVGVSIWCGPFFQSRRARCRFPGFRQGAKASPL